MVNIFITAAVISIIFLIVKFIEMRFVEKEPKPFKLLIRDTLLVYFSVVSGHFILDQLKPMMTGGGDGVPSAAPQVFVEEPGF